jgi:hypothetical protein
VYGRPSRRSLQSLHSIPPSLPPPRLSVRLSNTTPPPTPPPPPPPHPIYIIPSSVAFILIHSPPCLPALASLHPVPRPSPRCSPRFRSRHLSSPAPFPLLPPVRAVPDPPTRKPSVEHLRPPYHVFSAESSGPLKPQEPLALDLPQPRPWPSYSRIRRRRRRVPITPSASPSPETRPSTFTRPGP